MPARDRRDVTEHSGTDLSIVWIPVIFTCATLSLYVLAQRFTELGNGYSFHLKFPTSIEEISEMSGFLLSLKHNHVGYLLLIFSAGYIYKQTFAIPGSVFLNLLAGALFGPYYGFALTCSLSAVGATICYLLSKTFGRAYIFKYFPHQIRSLQSKIEDNRDGLFFFLLFLRLFPITPNWMMNMMAPIIGIPIHLFFLSVLIGLMPYNFVSVQTGSALSQISSLSDVFTTSAMLKMFVIAVSALVPGLIIKLFHVKQD